MPTASISSLGSNGSIASSKRKLKSDLTVSDLEIVRKTPDQFVEKVPLIGSDSAGDGNKVDKVEASLANLDFVEIGVVAFAQTLTDCAQA